MKTIDSFTPPLPEELLLDNDFFSLYPFDGGGHFIQLAQLGTKNDREIVAQIRSGALKPFMTGNYLDYLKFECWRTIEKACWLNRLYFIPPMARVARLDNNTELATLTVNYLLDFDTRYPSPNSPDAVRALNERVFTARDHDYNQGANLDGHTEYQWFDFQPASRVIHTIYAMFFLRAFPQITDEQWARLDAFVQRNAEVICTGEEQTQPAPGNHQALRALALLFAGTLFHNNRFLKRGTELANYHLTHDYLPDGMLCDMSPSYHIFETWIGRDADRLTTLSQPARDMLQRAYSICANLRSPDGFSIPLNDAYPLDMTPFLKSIGRDNARQPPVTILPDTHLAILSQPPFFAVLDGTPCTSRYAHFHGGKNALTLWADNEPFFIDSGCCSYDDVDFPGWFKQPQAHSSLLVNGIGDSRLTGMYDWQCTPSVTMNQGTSMSLSSPAPQWRNVTWTRSLVCSPTEIILTDTVSSPRETELTFIFNLAPNVSAHMRQDNITLDNGPVSLKLTWSASAPPAWKQLPGNVMLREQKTRSMRLLADITAQPGINTFTLHITIGA